jgi:hypothetical protein
VTDIKIKPITVGPPREPWERTHAGRIALGRAEDAEEAREFLDALDIQPTECRKKPEEAAS